MLLEHIAILWQSLLVFSLSRTFQEIVIMDHLNVNRILVNIYLNFFLD